MQCTNNLKQIGLALQNYHDTNGVFPPNCTGDGHEDHPSPWGAVSFYVALYPFMEQNALYNSVTSRGIDGFAAVWECAWDEFKVLIPMMGCPSDAQANQQSWLNRGQPGSYCGSRGDTSVNLQENAINQRGFFKGGLGARPNSMPRAFGWGRGVQCRPISAMTDGTSNTIAISEACVSERSNSMRVKGGTVIYDAGSPNSCLAMVSANDRSVYTGNRSNYNGRGSLPPTDVSVLIFTTVLPPNSPSCITADGLSSRATTSMVTWRFELSLRVNGALSTALCASFRNDRLRSKPWKHDLSLDRPNGKSPFGVWGAMGTIAGGETTTTN